VCINNSRPPLVSLKRQIMNSDGEECDGLLPSGPSEARTRKTTTVHYGRHIFQLYLSGDYKFRPASLLWPPLDFIFSENRHMLMYFIRLRLFYGSITLQAVCLCTFKRLGRFCTTIKLNISHCTF